MFQAIDLYTLSVYPRLLTVTDCYSDNRIQCSWQVFVADWYSAVIYLQFDSIESQGLT